VRSWSGYVRTEFHHDWSFIAETAVKIGNDVLEVGSHMNGVTAEFEVDLGTKGKVVIKVYNEIVAVDDGDLEDFMTVLVLWDRTRMENWSPAMVTSSLTRRF
jgi:hypothetical protein